MNPPLRSLLLGVSVASAVATVVGTALAPDVPRVAFVGSIMTGLLFTGLAWLAPGPLSAVYRTAVAGAVLLSAGGLLVGQSAEGTSVASLLVLAAGQLCYLVAFSTQAPVFDQRAAVVAYAIVATGLLALLLPTVGGVLRGELIGSVLVACAMAAQGASWLLAQPRSSSARLAAIGSACLVSAHGLMLLDAFAAVVPARSVLVFGGFWLAQGLLAASVERPAPPTLRL